MKSLDPFRISFSGINLIEASAGTGKTYNLSSLYIRALVEEEKTVDQILVVTYTEAATKELRDRLMKRLRESVQALKGIEFEYDEFLQQLVHHIDDKEGAIDKLKMAIRSFDEAAVFTIHGFCRRVLQNQAFESRALLNAELIGDDSEIVGEIVDDYWRNWVNEVSESTLKHPLLKFLMDSDYTPDSLTEELSSFIGKPYLHVQPERHPLNNIEEQLYELTDLFEALKKLWAESDQQIFEMLNNAPLAYYRASWLQSWMSQMDDWLQGDVAPIKLFDKFEKFTQSVINDSLKKNSDGSAPVHPFFEQADLYRSVTESLQQFGIHFKLELFEHLQQKIDAKKEQLQVFSFDDLLVKLNRALSDHQSGDTLRQILRNTYPVALVDEFQDTDPVQYQIFKKIYATENSEGALFMIGDPKQSIYSFRGADIFTYLQVKKAASEDKIFSLDRNFRSVPSLIDAVNALFSYREDPFILDKISFNNIRPGKKEYDCFTVNGEKTSSLEISTLNRPTDELPVTKGTAEERSAKDTANRIHHLLHRGRKGKAKIGDKAVEASDIAVLVRSHKQADIIGNALREKGIKSVQYSRKSVFKSEEAEELYYVLKAVAEPADEGLVKGALVTDFMGYTAEDLLQFEADEGFWIEKLEQFAGWQDDWQSHGIAYMLRQILADEDIPQKLMALPNGERKLTNVIHIVELLQQQEQQGKTGTRSLMHWFVKKRNEESKDQEEEQLRLESDEGLVKVVTMHRSKGLEYPIVFCPFLWKGPEFSDSGNPLVFHDTESDVVYLDFNGKDDPQRDRKRFQVAVEELAESLRLAYVAITRAKYQCTISWTQASKTEFSPLGYLLLGKKRSFDTLKKAISSDQRYESVDSALFEESLSELRERFPELFSFKNIQELQHQDPAQQDHQKTELQERTFKRKSDLEPGYDISSFSALIRGEQEQFETDYSRYFDEPNRALQTEGGTPERTFFNFPKGPNPGTAIHHIFEDIDFSASESWEPIINEQLEKQSIDRKWTPVVKKMLKTTLGKDLLPHAPGLKLKNINPTNFIPELEFYFTSGDTKLHELLSIIRSEVAASEIIDGFAEAGYLKGFIDLTFKYENRYYILDYKTNFLGSTLADYDADRLKDEMHEAFYDLQYHIYTVALHRFLNSRLNNYLYEEHFGGAFYLFLRGLNNQKREGIYFDRPEESRIRELDNYLSRDS